MNYKDFVASRAKPGADIIATLTPRKAHLLHMAVGIMGEAVELFNATTTENAEEECGDIEFYFVGMTLDEELHEATLLAGDFSGKWPPCSERSIVIEAGNLLDQVKKYVVYNKDNLQDVATALAKFGYAWGYYLNTSNVPSRFMIQEQNVAKLTKRYANGYSDKAAQERADKPAGE